MDYIVRPADKQDYQGLVDLFKSNPKTFIAYSDNNLLSEMLEKIPEILENPLYFTLVTLIDNEVTGAFITKEFEFQPCWTWGYWINKPGKLNSIWLEHGFEMMRSLSDQLFDEMETKRKLTRFFWSYPQQPDQTGIRTAGNAERWLASNVGIKFMPRARNYIYFDDCTIQAGTFPKYPYQKAIVGNKIWPMDIKIRMGVLNNTQGENNVG